MDCKILLLFYKTQTGLSLTYSFILNLSELRSTGSNLLVVLLLVSVVPVALIPRQIMLICSIINLPVFLCFWLVFACLAMFACVCMYMYTVCVCMYVCMLYVNCVCTVCICIVYVCDVQYQSHLPIHLIKKVCPHLCIYVFTAYVYAFLCVRVLIF